MKKHPLAGEPAAAEILVDVDELLRAYDTIEPDPSDPRQVVAFGTSGHRGCSLDGSFNKQHVEAIAQAIAEHRAGLGLSGPLFIGMDTHALSVPAQASAIEVLAANGVEILMQADGGHTPTPVISRAILEHNRTNPAALADGVVITPSHNPPAYGGLKYNPPHGGPADTATTRAIEKRANQLLGTEYGEIRRIPYQSALRGGKVRQVDFLRPYVEDLGSAVDMQIIAQSGLRLGVDPMGGSALAYWEPLAEQYKLSLQVVNERLDPTFSFMTVDGDGKIRMDCSSRWAMRGLIANRERFDIAFGNDPDADRHGIVTRSRGLLDPNHYLAAAIWYLFKNRPGWGAELAIGKTVVTSSMIDRVAGSLGRRLVEVPVGFKWFVDGLAEGRLAFGGEESAGASFLRRDGGVWTTDKDGILLNLLAAEMTARLGRDPGEIYGELEQKFGSPVYERIDAPATRRQKDALKNLSQDSVAAAELAGEPIIDKLTRAPGNDVAIGGLKVVCENGWFAARPSGTEDVYKIYAESFRGREHLKAIQAEAQQMIDELFSGLD